MSENSDGKGRSVTRGPAARFLGVSVPTVRRMEERGDLHPTIDENGIRHHSMEELKAVKEQRAKTEAQSIVAREESIDWADKDPDSSEPDLSGELASKLFAVFEEGRSLVDAVCRHKVCPELAEKAWDAWYRFKENDTSAPSVPGEIAELDADVALLGSQLGELTLRFNDLAEACLERFDALDKKIAASPLLDLKSRFECKSCGAKEQVAVEVKCTKCNQTTWRGWWPKRTSKK